MSDSSNADSTTSSSATTASNSSFEVKSASKVIASLESVFLKTNNPDFGVGDTVKVHARIVEGTKERVQVFEGVVIKRHGRGKLHSTFTVRKVSYNIGVERTFMLHSPRIDKIEVTSRGVVRRSKLFYLRDLRGKSARIKRATVDTNLLTGTDSAKAEATAEVLAA